MKIKNKNKKIFGTFATTLAFSSLFSLNVFAATINREKISDTPLFRSGTSESNYIYTIEDNDSEYNLGERYAYSVNPENPLLTSKTISKNNEYFFDEVTSWIIDNTEDKQLAQAAIWKLQDKNVEAINGGNINQVDSIISQAMTEINLHRNAEVLFDPDKIEMNFEYNAQMDAYVSNNFSLGYYESVSRSGEHEYFIEKLISNLPSGQKYEKVDVAEGIGSYRFVIPRNIALLSDLDNVKDRYISLGHSIKKVMYSTDVWGTADQAFISSSGLRSSSITNIQINTNLKLYMNGDMNHDGFINSTDASIVLDLFKNKGATQLDYNIGDMNHDGQLNSTDASMILDIFKNSSTK